MGGKAPRMTFPTKRRLFWHWQYRQRDSNRAWNRR